LSFLVIASTWFRVEGVVYEMTAIIVLLFDVLLSLTELILLELFAGLGICNPSSCIQ
jgi:hypothetical protein